MKVRGYSDLSRDHKAEGVGFEPTMSVTTHSGFQDRRHRPLGEPSRVPNLTPPGSLTVPDAPGYAARRGAAVRDLVQCLRNSLTLEPVS